MSDIPAFPYDVLLEKRRIRSVANLTREDGKAFMCVAGEISLKTVETRPLRQANRALADLRDGLRMELPC